jgi:rare lipoprotein A
MRKLLMTIAFALASTFAAATAATARGWACEGADYVCGAGKSTAKVTADDSESKPARASKSRRAAVSTNNDDAPVRAAKARKQRVASVTTYDDEKPARRKRARNTSSDNDSGGGASTSGKASYYWQPQALASGGRFNPNAMTAAHKTLPFGTRVRVTNQNNGQSVDVVINDRGPYVGGRIIDLSKAAAHSINMQGSGVAPVTVRVLGRG